MANSIEVNAKVKNSQMHLITQLSALCNETRKTSYCLFSGLPGSGKTQVLLQLLVTILKHNPEAKVLLLGATKTAVHCLNQRIDDLITKNGFLEATNQKVTASQFITWCRGDLKGLHSFVFDDEVLNIVETSRGTNQLSEHISAHGLMREINYIKSHNIDNVVDYIQARKCHSVSFTEQQYHLIWKAVQDFSFELRLKRKHLWVDLPRMLWKQLEANQNTIREYDFIFLDDVDQLTPFWLNILNKALTPSRGKIIAANSLINSNASQEVTDWFEKKLTANHNGKSNFILKDNFRCHQMQMGWMNHYFSIREGGFNAFNHLLYRPLKSIKGKKVPFKLRLQAVDEEDELLNVVDEINHLPYQDNRLKEVLVLCANPLMVKVLSRAMARLCQIKARVCLASEFYESKDDNQTMIKIDALDGAFGIEADHVIIMGLSYYYEIEFSESLSLIESRLSMMEHTRSILQGVSRAKKSVTLFYTHNHLPGQLMPPEFRKNVENDALLRYG